MPYFKVKIEQGAFIDGSLYRMDEVVQLPEGHNPNWGVRCEPDGTELESMSEKMLNVHKIQNQLASAISGDSDKTVKNIVKENAELKQRLANIEAMLQTQPENKPVDPEAQDDTDGDAGDGATGDQVVIDEVLKSQIKEAVDLLEDDNNEHWTSRGEPAMAKVQELVGNEEITRADVTEANPRQRVKPAKK